MAGLTTTSYAILGQLALRPRSIYELASEMRRNLHYFWPRAESLVYAEVKRLAGLKLVSATHSYTGRRRTTTYTITPTGLETVQAWLATPPQRALLEFEGLLRVMFGPLGTTEELLAALEEVRADAEELLTFGAGIQDEYLRGEAPFQEHTVFRAHMHDFLVRYARMRRDWADQTIAAIRVWEHLTPEERRDRAMCIFEQEPVPRGSRANQPGALD